MAEKEEAPRNEFAINRSATFRTIRTMSGMEDPALNNFNFERTVSRRTAETASLETRGDNILVSNPAGQERVINEEEIEDAALSKHDKGWRRIVRNFSPSWFSVTMGTGIVSILFWFIPFRGDWMYIISIIIFVLNVILFFLGLTISILRYTLYPEIWFVMLQDQTNRLFLAVIPVSFSTIIEMWIFVCVPAWGGEGVKTFAWILWMINTVVAVGATVGLSFTLMVEQTESPLSKITAVQLLPISATIIVAGVGAEVAEILPNPQHALGTIITSFVIWGMGIPLAFQVLTLYYHRLAIHHIPPREVIVSCLLPLSSLSFGGYSIMYLGKVARTVFPATNTLSPAAGEVFYALGFVFALLMWGFAFVWLILATAIIIKSRPFPFNMGWWGFVFPLGSFAVCAIQIGHEMPSQAFKYIGTICAVAVILLWLIVAARTAAGAWSGTLFYAPCIKTLDMRKSVVDVDEADEEAKVE